MAQTDHEVPHLHPTSLHCHQHPHISTLTKVAVHGHGPRAEFHGAETMVIRGGRCRIGSFLRHNMHKLAIKSGHYRQGQRVPIRGALAVVVDAEDIYVDDNRVGTVYGGYDLALSCRDCGIWRVADCCAFGGDYVVFVL